MREERKRVTALFADVVDSTVLAESRDPEDVREVLGAVIERIIVAVESLGGTVKDLAGDGVLALFGAPLSHEDDELRAVLCGLRILDEIEAYRRDATVPHLAQIEIRVGIDTGTVVVGPVGASGRVEYGAVGDAVNTAARLHSRTAPGTVLVSAETCSWVADDFDWGAAESHELKGKSKPVVARRVLRVRRDEPDRAVPPRGQLVGRLPELRQLREHIEEMTSGQGRVLFVVGEPGVGKSRLLEESAHLFRERVGPRGRWAVGRCVALGRTVPLLPFRGVVRQRLELPEGEAAALALARSGKGSDVPFLAHLLELSVLNPDLEAGLAGMSAEDIQRRVFEAVLDIVLEGHEEHPTAVVLEDLHWADPSSVQLLERITEAVRERAVMVLATLRTEVDTAAWHLKERLASAGHAGVRTVVLDRLPPDDAAALLHRLVGGAPLPRALEERILRAAEGNPLFLQQVVRSLEDGGGLVRGGEGPEPDDGASIEVPTSIEKVITSRIDRLDETCYEAVSLAAVIGREFSADLLCRAAPSSVGMAGALTELCRIQLVRRLSDEQFEFNHVLLQQTVLRSLLRRRRRELHARVGEALAALTESLTGEAALVIGRHFAQAELPDRAVPQLLVAADRARATFANEEAVALYDAILRMAEPLAEHDAARWSPMVLHALEKLGDVHRQLGHYAAAVDAYQRGLAHASRCEAGLARPRLRRLVGSTRLLQHRYPEAEDAFDDAARALKDVEPQDDNWWHEWLDVRFARGDLAYWSNDHETHGLIAAEVRSVIDQRGSLEQRADFYWLQVLANVRRLRFRLPPETVSDARSALAATLELGAPFATAWARFNMGFALLWSGQAAAAVEELIPAYSHAQTAGDRELMARAAAYLVVSHRLLGDRPEVERWLARSGEAAELAVLPEYEAMNRANRSWVEWRALRDETARAEAESALELWESLTPRYAFDWMALWPLIGTALRRGDLTEALRRARMLGADHQQLPPPELEDLVEQALAAERAGDAAGASDMMHAAARRARTLNYL